MTFLTNKSGVNSLGAKFQGGLLSFSLTSAALPAVTPESTLIKPPAKVSCCVQETTALTTPQWVNESLRTLIRISDGGALPDVSEIEQVASVLGVQIAQLGESCYLLVPESFLTRAESKLYRDPEGIALPISNELLSLAFGDRLVQGWIGGLAEEKTTSSDLAVEMRMLLQVEKEAISALIREAQELGVSAIPIQSLLAQIENEGGNFIGAGQKSYLGAVTDQLLSHLEQLESRGILPGLSLEKESHPNGSPRSASFNLSLPGLTSGHDGMITVEAVPVGENIHFTFSPNFLGKKEVTLSANDVQRANRVLRNVVYGVTQNASATPELDVFFNNRAELALMELFH